ncbi:MlaD family protein [Flavobacterium sp.]|uniref:MlaD family protein n=1 Tax=Flavobacterium sp. TaxID=239 RepID=UPI003F69A642
MKLTKEIKTAILVISSIMLFIWGYSFLKGRDLFTNYKTFFVKYDNVEGLTTSSTVTINGKTIGKVIEIKLDENWKNIVKIQIDGDYKLSKSSVAEIYAPSPIGGKQIAILPGSGADLLENEQFMNASSKLGLADELSSQLVPLKDKVEVLLNNANAMLVNVNQVLDDKSKENLRNSLANLNVVLAEFSSASKNVNAMLADNKKNITSTMTNLEKTSSNFSKVSDSLAKIQIGQTVKSLENTLVKVDAILADMQSGKGTLGKIMKDDAMYTNFTNASKELELLLQDLRLNPTRYINVSVFGKKNKPYIAPEEETNESTEE